MILNACFLYVLVQYIFFYIVYFIIDNDEEPSVSASHVAVSDKSECVYFTI